MGRWGKAVAVIGFAWQAAAPGPVRIGDVARTLSNQDVIDLERVVSGTGARPWLLNGPRGMIPDLKFIEAYFPPETTTRDVRRGSVQELLGGPAKALSMMGVPAGQSGWTLRSRRSYAQVAIPGRDFGQVAGDEDLNRPFIVTGRFDDDELASLIRFVRSSPPGPKPEAGGFIGAVRGDWPVVAVNRNGDSVDVRIRMSDLSRQLVRLRQHESTWIIVSILLVFA